MYYHGHIMVQYGNKETNDEEGLYSRHHAMTIDLYLDVCGIFAYHVPELQLYENLGLGPRVTRTNPGSCRISRIQVRSPR